MSKRKAEVNDIIYELDSEDLESSSEDEKKEATEAKRNCPDAKDLTPERSPEVGNTTELNLPPDETDSSNLIEPVLSVSTETHYGGKQLPDDLLSVNSGETNIESNIEVESKPNDDCRSQNHSDSAILFNEDMVPDSPSSISNVAIGCANRLPLVTVTFKNKQIARNYKQCIKEFMLKLIKLHDEESLNGSENETDLELDIWPEDLTGTDEGTIDDESQDKESQDDTLFFVDTDPNFGQGVEIPQYSQTTSMLCEELETPTKPPPPPRRGPHCFNCDGPHPLRDCKLPRNNMKIMEKRKAMVRVGRYHVEDDQKYGHLVPGRISGSLRHALGLRRDELPLYIYKMRMLGYPPGWLEEAKISHSGIVMFDSTGTAIQDPEEEEGEVSEPGSKDKYDIKKILDFPGFNVPPSKRYVEEAHRYNLPPMSEQDSKLNMLQVLAPNAMKAYKRKKLTFFPSASPNATILGQAEMELDDGDEVADFPSVPPLPDDAPPPPPPRPPSPPPLPPDFPAPDPALDTSDKSLDKSDKSLDKSSDATVKGDECADSVKDKEEDCVVVDVMQVKDIPVPETLTVKMDEDEENPLPSSGRDSPSLADLEEKKRMLLEALDGGIPSSPDSVSLALLNQKLTESDSEASKASLKELPSDDNASTSKPGTPLSVTVKSQERPDSDSDSPKTTISKAGHVKQTSYGTPILNAASSFIKLPSDDKFAKDICDVINFENLPDSTGKYEKISTLLKRVKSEVDRIQES